jgi:hypothetical protein
MRRCLRTLWREGGQREGEGSRGLGGEPEDGA